MRSISLYGVYTPTCMGQNQEFITEFCCVRFKTQLNAYKGLAIQTQCRNQQTQTHSQSQRKAVRDIKLQTNSTSTSSSAPELLPSELVTMVREALSHCLSARRPSCPKPRPARSPYGQEAPGGIRCRRLEIK